MRVKEAAYIVKNMATSTELESKKYEAICTLLDSMGGFQFLSRTDLFKVGEYLLRENRRLKSIIKEFQEGAK